MQLFAWDCSPPLNYFSIKNSTARGLYSGFSKNRRNKLLIRIRSDSILFTARPLLDSMVERSFLTYYDNIE